MPRAPIRALVVAALLCPAALASAQEKPTTVGVGVDLNNFVSVISGGATPLSIYIPINLPSFRIEPTVGLLTQSVSGGGSASSIALGVGGLFPFRSAREFTAMVGGRLQLAFNRESPPGGPSSSSNDVYLAGVLAGEWAANPHFSLAAEAQVGYYDNGTLGGTPGVSGLRTAGLVIARFFL